MVSVQSQTETMYKTKLWRAGPNVKGSPWLWDVSTTTLVKNQKFMFSLDCNLEIALCKWLLSKGESHVPFHELSSSTSSPLQQHLSFPFMSYLLLPHLHSKNICPSLSLAKSLLLERLLDMAIYLPDCIQRNSLHPILQQLGVFGHWGSVFVFQLCFFLLRFRWSSCSSFDS